MIPASRVVSCAIVCLAIFAFTPQAPGQMYEGKQLVKAELLADTNAVVPGRSFTVGLLLHMAPGWHTYWKFPGDAGIPTELKWQLPAGWKVGELQWPIPLKLSEPGDIRVYGYHNDVLLMQDITPSRSLAGSPVTLSAEAQWLVCEKICIPGNANLQLTLPVSTSSRPANAELFAHYRALLPKAAEGQWSRNDSGLNLKIDNVDVATAAFADFYPSPPPDVVVGHPSIASRSASQINFRIPLESAGPNISSLAGLVVFGQSPDATNRSALSIGSVTQVAAQATQALSTSRARGVWTFLFLGFLGGIILNLMPCVLPVISLKIFGFIQHAGQSRQKIFRTGIAFAGGIFTWFLGLALLLIALKAAGRDITWGGFQFTNPYFVLALSVVVLVFALDLFGVFEIALPQRVTRGLLGWTGLAGDAGSFVQGLFATVLATPCTAPFLGTALGFAFAQPPAIILSMFVAISAGMSAPYLLICAHPAWLRLLPTPGPWMVHVKQFMGFLLLATLLFLLYVLGAQRGLEGAIWVSCFLLVVGIACWMKGAFIVPTATARKKVVVLTLMFVLVIGSGVYFIGGKFRATGIVSADSRLRGDWQPFTTERLQAELEQDHQVFVDFTAAWCITCKFNEANVLESDPVREAFQRHGIVKLKADWTNGDPVITKLLQNFGRPGVPLYVLYPGTSERPIVFPELLTRSIILEKLEATSRALALQ
jgi:thiol:disulfide interchange protein/DsbC/DsbD-like thiol-disulfide interchange protein